MSVEELVKGNYPLLEKEIFQYICGILQSPDDFESSEDIFEAVGGVLTESLEECDEEEAKDFCDTLYIKLCGGNGGDPGCEVEVGVAKLLDAPVHLAMRLKDDDTSAFSSILMAQGPDSRKNVDKKKLDKADAKIKQKQEKKALKEKEIQPKEIVLAAPTTNQAVTKQVSRAEAAGGVVGDIKIDNFDIAFGSNVLLSCAEMNLIFSRRYGLVGRNGVGKTTLLRAIAHRELHLPSHVSVLHVEQEVVGDETTAVDSVLESDEERCRLLRREKELMMADGVEEESGPNSPGMESGELSQIYQRLQEIESDKAPARAACILAGLGFSPEMQGRRTSEFSGGWRMRIALARALFAKPDLLLLDEPTNMLDIKAIMWLEDYLQSWPTTILTVSHDRMFLAIVCTDIIHMHNERLDGYRGDYETFVKTKTEKFRNQQKEYEAQLQYRQHLQDFIDRWRYNAKRASAAQMRIKVLEKLPVLKPVEIDAEVKFRFQDVDSLSPPILQLNDVTFGYTPGRDNSIFTKTNISADMESRIALVGENGSGKTTLVKLLTGELCPNDGYRNAHRNLKIAYFTQHHVDQLVLDVSAFEFIQSKFPGKKDEEYRHQLGAFGISGDLALRPIASLSGGQKSRLAFALLANTRPNFLILDEPTNHLDVETVDALGRALSKFKGGIVLVSHDQHLIKMCATEVWLCKNKTVQRLEGGLEQYKIALENEFRTN